MQRVVIIKFDGQSIRTELPLPSLFTGQIQLVFNWKDGKLMNAMASKSESAQISTDLDTLQRGQEGI